MELRDKPRACEIRVFISSNSLDMKKERDHLVRFAFPHPDLSETNDSPINQSGDSRSLSIKPVVIRQSFGTIWGSGKRFSSEWRVGPC